MICGNNPLFQLFLAVLSTEKPLTMQDIPRFRDMYTLEEEGIVKFGLYTRTGGGNRPDYEAQNAVLASHPLYEVDYDDDFDSTFAHFIYRVPDEYQERMLKLHQIFSKHPKGWKPQDKFKAAMAALENKPYSPTTEEFTDKDNDELNILIQELAPELGLV